MKGYVYCCIERENGYLYDKDFIDRDRFVLSPKEAVTSWTSLCNNIIDYLSKENKEVTVVFEEHISRVKLSRVIDCNFYVDGEYTGYATLSFSND